MRPQPLQGQSTARGGRVAATATATATVGHAAARGQSMATASCQPAVDAARGSETDAARYERMWLEFQNYWSEMCARFNCEPGDEACLLEKLSELSVGKRQKLIYRSPNRSTFFSPILLLQVTQSVTFYVIRVLSRVMKV